MQLANVKVKVKVKEDACTSARLQAWKNNTEDNRHNITIRVAATIEELRSAFRIGYEVYREEGFVPYHPSAMRVTGGHLRSSTVVLLAYCDGQAVGTLSLYEDGSDGLPSETVWPVEMGRLRAEGRRMTEFGTLLMRKDKPELKLRVCLEMFRFAWLYARTIRGNNTICAFVRRKHLWFYKKLMNFKPFGHTPLYQCNGLTMKDCIFMFMDLKGAEEDFRRRFEKYGDTPRNLYRRFVHHERARMDRHLQNEVRRHEERKWMQLQQHFEPLCTHSIEAKGPLKAMVTSC